MMTSQPGPGTAGGSGAVKNPKKRSRENNDGEIEELEELMEQDKPKKENAIHVQHDEYG